MIERNLVFAEGFWITTRWSLEKRGDGVTSLLNTIFVTVVIVYNNRTPDFNNADFLITQRTSNKDLQVISLIPSFSRQQKEGTYPVKLCFEMHKKHCDVRNHSK